MSGKDRQTVFPVFACLYWSVPYGITVWYNIRDNVSNYSKLLSFLNRIGNAIVYEPFNVNFGQSGADIGIMPVIFPVCVFVFYFIGYTAVLLYEKNNSEKSAGIEQRDV